MSSLTQTKIKVNRVELITQLESVLARGKHDYDEKVTVWKDARVRAKTELEASLKTRVVKDYEVVGSRYGDSPATLTISSKTKIPAEPKDHACNLRNTIAVLKLSKEETVLLSADQYGEYFPCET